MSETRENPQSDTDDVTDQHEHVDNDMKASIWFFKGTFDLDLDPNEWTEDEIRGILPRDDLVPRVEAHFRTDYFKKPPVPIHYMEIGIEFFFKSKSGWSHIHGSDQWTSTSTIGLRRNLELMAAVPWQHRIHTLHRS